MKFYSSSAKTHGSISRQLTYKDNVLESEVELVYLSNQSDVPVTLLTLLIDSALDIFIAEVPDAVNTDAVGWENTVILNYKKLLNFNKLLQSGESTRFVIKHTTSYFVPVRLNDLSLKVEWL